jgi:hypothetical protein
MSPTLNEAANLMLGDQQVSAVYVGESKIWELPTAREEKKNEPRPRSSKRSRG